MKDRTNKSGTQEDSPQANAGLPKEWYLNALRSMCEIRNFEEHVYDLVRSGTIKGASHLYAGEEAVAVGAVSAITRADFITSTHRGHGHCGAIGDLWADNDEERQQHWNQMMAELMGRETGYCKGRGGSMHIADVQKGNLGATGIVGGNIPIATGAALAEKLKGSDAVILCFFGDGASNIAMFHESLNFASVMQGGLPVVYISENNLYGMSVPFHDRTVDTAPQAAKIRDISTRAAAYGIPGESVDGQDVLAVRDAVLRAVERARHGEGPTLIECKTYRYFGHSLSDQRTYRTKEEEQYYREQRDPISLLTQRIVANGIATEIEVEQIQAKAKETIEKSIEFAKSSPLPDPSELYENIYVAKDPNDLEREKESESVLRARIRPIENEIRAMCREAAGGTIKGALPKLKKDQADELQQRYQIPIKAYNEALVMAHDEEMARDERVFLMGEDVGLYGGAYAASRGLYQKYGPKRVMDTPISEVCIAGAGAGAAMRGMRPIAEFQYVDFTTLASDQLVHNAAYNRYMFGGKTKVPVVYRSQGGVGRCIAAHHSESMEAWFLYTPGLYVVMPSTPYDAKGLLKASIRDENPVLFIEHKILYSGVQGPVPEEDYIIPLGVADIKRPGNDVTIISYSRMIHFALDAALELEEKHGLDAEVIDPRTLNPLDVKCPAESVKKTGRLIVVSEGFPKCGVAGEIARQILEYRFEDGYTGFDYLDMPPKLISAKDVPVPMSEPLEDAAVPSREDIVAAALYLCG